jgi:hypothetical protein
MSRELKLNIISDIDKIKKMSDLEDIWDACSDRMGDLKKAKTRRLKEKLHVGDVVRLSTRMKPRYLCEVEAPITELKGNTATLQLPDDPSLRRMSGTFCRVPLSAIAARVRKAE